MGPNWTKDPTWGSGLSISGNKVVATNSGVHYWNANTFAADQYSQIRLTGVVGLWSSVFVRGDLRPGPSYMVAVKPGGADLYSSSNGTFSQLAHDATDWATGDVLRLEVRTVAPSTARLTVYRNGTELFSYDDAEHFIASGQPGIGLLASTGGMSLDDWEGGDTVASSPPPPNQVAAFSFSEGSGTTTIDNSGSGHDGTLVNGPTWTAGKYGNGLSFDGTDDYVSVANPAGVNLGDSDFTIAAWVMRQVTGVEDNILSKTASGAWVSGGKEFFISGSDNTLAFGSYGLGEVHSTGTIISDGLWHYVTVSFVDSSRTLRLYIDGVLSGTGTLNLPADDVSHAIRIGSNPGGSLTHGALDELRIFNRALSGREIVSIMGTAIVRPAPDATPPARPNGQPSGTLPAGTRQPTLSLVTSENASPTPTPVPTPIPSLAPANPAGLANVSTRLFVQTGDNVMIGGFIIAGDVPKKIILRAIGPSLATFGISGAMAQPALRLYDSTGAVIASNDNWRSDQSQIIEDTGLASADDREAALVTTLLPGAYTAVVNDESNNPGVALFEFYDLDPASSQLTNLSTRGKVETEDRVMIGGFVVSGDQPTEIILRAIGPSLTQLGIPDALANPTLELHNGDGSLVLQNDNWRSDQEQQILDSALAPSDDRESAIIATLIPGSYTAIVRGAGNSTGIALFEIYRLTP